jgi:stringent starvation protein B
LGKPCPICEYKGTLDFSDEDDLKQIKRLNTQERQLYNIVLPSETADITKPKIYILDQSRFYFGKIIDDLILHADEDDEYQYYVDIEKGSTLKLNIEEKKTDTFKYYGVSTVEFKRRKYRYDESIFDLTVDLDAVLQIMPYDELKDMFFETGKYAIDAKSKDSSDDDEPPAKQKTKSKPPVEDDEDDDETPPVKPKKKVLAEEEESVSPKKKSKVAFDDDEDDEDDVPSPKQKSKAPFDDDDDDEPPVKPKAKAKPPIDDDDEEPPVKPKKKTPVEDDDDEEPPVKSAKATKRSIVEDWDDED